MRAGERLRIFAVLRRPSSDTLGQAQWLSRFGPMRLDVALVDPDPSPTTSVAASAASPLSPVSAIAAMGLPSDRRIVLRRGSVCVPTVGAGHSAGPPGAADAADTDACVVYDTDVTFSVGPDLLEKPLLLSMTLLPAESPSPALHKALRRAMNTGTAAGLYSELAKRAPGDRPRALPSRTISTQVVVLQPLVATASEALVGGTTYISVALSNTHPWRAVTVTDAQFHIRSTRPAPLGPIPTHLRAATAFLEGVEGGQGDDSVSSAELGGVGAGALPVNARCAVAPRLTRCACRSDRHHTRGCRCGSFNAYAVALPAPAIRRHATARPAAARCTRCHLRHARTLVYGSRRCHSHRCSCGHGRGCSLDRVCLPLRYVSPRHSRLCAAAAAPPPAALASRAAFAARPHTACACRGAAPALQLPQHQPLVAPGPAGVAAAGRLAARADVPPRSPGRSAGPGGPAAATKTTPVCLPTAASRAGGAAAVGGWRCREPNAAPAACAASSAAADGATTASATTATAEGRPAATTAAATAAAARLCQVRVCLSGCAAAWAQLLRRNTDAPAWCLACRLFDVFMDKEDFPATLAPGEAFSLVIAIEPRRKVSADLGVPPLGSLCSVLTLTWRASGMTRGVHLHRLLTWTRPRAESPPVLLSVQCPAPAPSARVFPVIVTVTNASPAAANLSLSCPAPAAYDLVDLPPASAAGAGDAAAQHAPLSPSGGSLVAAADKVEVRRMVDAGSWQPALASRQAFRLMCLETRLPLGWAHAAPVRMVLATQLTRCLRPAPAAARRFVAAGSSVTVTLHALSPLCGMHVLDQLLVRDEVTGAAFKQARPLEVMVQ